MLTAVSLLAEDNPKNAVSFSFASSNSTIAYRRSFGAFAALVSAGYSEYTFHDIDTNYGNRNYDFHSWTAGAGLRRYLVVKNAVQVFAQADLSRSLNAQYGVIAVTGTTGCDKPRATTAALTGGVEYHLSRSISIEGAAGISGSRTVSRCTGDSFSYYDTSHSISTFRSAVALNFYF